MLLFVLKILNLLYTEDNMFDEKTLQNLMQQSINETVEHEFKEVLEKGSMPQLQTLLENLLNKFMLLERDFIINSNNDVGNGFYKRSLITSLGKLNLNVPRIRHNHYTALPSIP